MHPIKHYCTRYINSKFYCTLPAPPSASLMPRLPGCPERRLRRSGAPPLSGNAPRRAREVPLPAAPRHVRRKRGVGAMYYIWGMEAGSVLDHESYHTGTYQGTGRYHTVALVLLSATVSMIRARTVVRCECACVRACARVCVCVVMGDGLRLSHLSSEEQHGRQSTCRQRCSTQGR